jgi:alanine racemase
VSASNPIPPARAWADIDLGALVANARTVLSVSGSRLLPMVKANAYGTGAVEAARALEAVDPWGFGVATIAEGAILRRSGIRRPILVFSPLTADAADECVKEELRPVIGDLSGLRLWLAKGDRPFHVEIDTGMGRLGFPWRDRDRLAEAAGLLASAPGWEGIFTHFHSADTDLASVHTQWHRFMQVMATLPSRSVLVHAANSAAALRGKAFAGDLVRPGIFLYGGAVSEGPPPRTVVRLKAPVVATRRVETGDTVSYGATWRAEGPTNVATLAIGYADGVPRSLGTRGTVELGGTIRPIVGRITMDFIMVDVGEADVPCGAVATLYGGALSLDAQAAAAGTVSYELLTALGTRVPRHYGGSA